MCGILGWYKFGHASQFSETDASLFNDALKTIHHRGPDAGAVLTVQPNLMFGHRRLSIIDLSETNNQPFVSRDGNYSLTYNGEIFNYREIRNELVSLGNTFATAGDTEVVLQAYAQWGEQCVNRFNGMWAFAIYDRHNRTLFCSRDRFGIKPFNYYLRDSELSFCSESKGILKLYPEKFAPNHLVMGNFLRKTVGAQLEDTWFEGIKRLMPAHNMVVKDGVVRTYRYWQYPLTTDRQISAKDAQEQYANLLEDAVKLRMISDVPVGTTLSSGLDSSSLVALMRRSYQGEHNTYTAFSPKENFHALENSIYKGDIDQDESSLVKMFAQQHNLKTHFVDTDHNDYMGQIDKLVYFLEAPHHSQSVVPLFQLMQRASKDVKVVLEGQGADELLGGYITLNAFAYSYSALKKAKFGEAFKNLSAVNKHYSLMHTFQSYIRALDINVAQKYFQSRSGYEKLYTGPIANLPILKDSPFECPGFDDDFNRHLHNQHTGTLVDLLHYGDRISMANSLESRLPFMDYRLVEFAFRLPARMKVSNGMGKVIHRQAMQGVLPGFIANNPHKFGFSTPLAKILMDDAANSPAKKLLNGSLVDSGMINVDQLKNVVREHKEGRHNHSRVLYRLLGMDSWLRQFAA